MTRVYVMALVTTALLAHGLPRSIGAASKYNACGLLTAAELKAAVNLNVHNSRDSDVVIPTKPLASESGMRPFASCIMQSKGLAFWLGVGGTASLTPQQVRALADKMVAWLP